MQKLKPEFARRLKRARQAAGLSQSEAAAKWGAKLRTLQDWELGRNEPRGFARTQLEKLLSEILGETPPRKRRGI
jgi:ribosome-binding protein aMBF1 (putative translation factor)